MIDRAFCGGGGGDEERRRKGLNGCLANFYGDGLKGVVIGINKNWPKN